MTDQEINIAIAEACGWKKIEPTPNAPWGYTPKDKKWTYPHHLPNYCFSLDAIVQATTTVLISPEQKVAWLNTLRSLLPKPCSDWDLSHVNARQRAEAFLRVLGKWKEG